MSGILADHDLGGAAGAVIAGQKHAVLEVDLVVERLEGPDVAVGQYQHDAARIAEAARLHRGMQMKPQGKIALGALDARAWRRRDGVFAVEPAAVLGDHQHPAMHDAEPGEVAVMRRGQEIAVGHCLAVAFHIGRAADDGRALQQSLNRRQFDELARGGVMIGQGRMRRGAARKAAPIVAAGRGHAAIDDDPARTGRQFEREATGMRFLADIRRRRRPGVHDDGRRAGIEALEAGMRHVRHRHAVGVVIGEQGGHQVRGRVAHAVEQRKAAVAVTEETQHRHHAVNRIQ